MNAEMYEDERGIDFKQVLIYLWEHIIVIFLMGIIFAVLLGGYKAYDMNKGLDDKEVFDSIIEQNRAASNPVSGEYIYNTEREIIEGTCVVKTQINMDYNFDGLNISDNMDYNGIWGRFQIDANSTLLRSDVLASIASEVNQKEYDDIKLDAEKLRYMINYYFGGANVAYISVTDVNKDRALDIMNLLGRHFVENASQLENVKEAQIVSSPVFAYDTTDNTTTFSIIKLIKFVLVGGFIGVVLACGILFLIYLINDTVRASDDIECIGLDAFVRIPTAKDKKKIECKRAAYKISLLEDCERLLVVPVDCKTNIKDMCNIVLEELIKLKCDVKLIQVEDIVSSPDAILEAKNSDAVVLVSTYGVSRFKDLVYAKTEMIKTGTEILGVVVNNCKH